MITHKRNGRRIKCLYYPFHQNNGLDLTKRINIHIYTLGSGVHNYEHVMGNPNQKPIPA